MSTRLRLSFSLSLALIANATLAGAPLSAEVSQIESPAGSGAMGSSLISNEGRFWLSWLEPVGEERHALKCARFDPTSRSWGKARLIAEGAGWFVNWADFPVLAVLGDRLTAAWFVRNDAPESGGGSHDHSKGYFAKYSVSTDGGDTWTKPELLTKESTSVEFVAFQAMPDGRLLAAWLDGRARATTNRQTVYARFVGQQGADTLVDESVCDCCQLSFAPSPSGGAMLAYRGRTEDEIRDMRVVRYEGGKWEKPRPLSADGWKIPACPVNGPQLATAGDSTAAAWFTAANGNPRVYAARSPRGKNEFGAPTVVDLGHPMGRVDNLMLADGTALITWLESSGKDKEGGIYFRQQAPSGSLSEPVLIAPTTTTRASGFPRIALLQAKPTSFLISYTREGETSSVATAVVNVR